VANRNSTIRAAITTLAIAAAVCPLARAAEHIVLRNGFELDCARRETTGDRVRLYLLPTSAGESTNYMEVAATAILRAETIPDPPLAPLSLSPSLALSARKIALSSHSAAEGSASLGAAAPSPTPAEMHQLLASAGARHNIDIDLLASLIHAESNGNAHAVSRAGAQGLMQLMPGTATELGVQNSFAPEQNISGGTTYLDALLTRYHDNMALALAAYNAGPAAVDRYHGIPPYAETRAYVARVIREFNRLKHVANTTQIATAK
jgi:soluble lytic murein transglycosylase-like protein